MVWDTGTFGGSQLSYWRMNARFTDSYNGVPNGGVNDLNDKEDALGWGMVSDAVYRLWCVLGQYPEHRELVEWGLKALLLTERKWHLKTGVASNFPEDRVQHPFNRMLNHYYMQSEIAEKDPALYEKVAAELRKGVTVRQNWISGSAAERAAWCRAKLEWAVNAQEAEMCLYENGDYGECATWAYNVYAATKESQRNTRREDGYQPTVYVWHAQVFFMQTGINGLGIFATERFQRALANTQYAVTQPAPLRYRRVGEEAWNDVFAWLNHAPVSKRIVDSKNRKGQAEKFTFTNNHQTRTLTHNAIVPRTTPGSGDQYFQETTWGNDAGGALMFGSDDLLEYSRREWGTAEKPTSRADDVGWLCGYALRLGIQAGLIKWS